MMTTKKLFTAFVAIILFSCSTAPTEKPLIVKEDPEKALSFAKEVRESTAIQLAEGIEINLWASDSLAPDPIAMAIDDEGRVYITSSNRMMNSEFDIRGHRDWMIPSISFQSVEDRRAFLRKTFAPERSKENEWLEDLNHDGIHDWHDLTVEKDEVWRLEDTNGDGLADISTRIVNDFNEEITDVAEGVLVRKEDMFVAIGPDLWRLQDTNGDDIPDKKESISHGYAVHIGFGGHGMSGIVEGPDGKIYWGIGDIGANLVDKSGKKHFYPNQGVIVRSNPDGTDFEVFAHGLRNTYEFVFDEYGNMISSDNDGDHQGESERLVHIVEGTDLGWRSNWQYGKYTDPKNNRYNVWMDERFYVPRWEGQAAHIIPPIQNYHNGPTGMIYNPGTALGSKWRNRFFLVEFVGTPSRSHIWSFTLKPKGATFELNDEIDMVSGILPTGIRFGPDGAMYVADWITGWNTKNYGRVWRLDVNAENRDFEKERKDTEWNMKLDYSEVSDETLGELLSHGDMRIRQKAQFELVTRGKKGEVVFKQSIQQRQDQLSRIHAIWGIGQLAETDANYGKQIISLLDDVDQEIVTQAAKVLGDRKMLEAADKLIPLLKSANPRIKFYAAQALGRMKYNPAIQPLIQMIDANNDEDLYIRHAGVLALSRIGDANAMAALVKNPERDLRIAAVLVLRNLGSEMVSLFLKDEDEYIVTEAARAINDDLSITQALPALAAILDEKRFKEEPLLRRAINACSRLGTEKDIDRVIAFARRGDVSPALRAEALATLGVWPNPSVVDRVDGYYRGEVNRDATAVTNKVKAVAEEFLKAKDGAVVTAASKMLTNLNISDFNNTLAQLVEKNGDADVRSSVLKDLQSLSFSGMESLIKVAMNDKDEKVRTTAIGMMGDLKIADENLAFIINPIFGKGTVGEQQQLLLVLGKMKTPAVEKILSDILDQLIAKKLSPGITLELLEAIDSTKSSTLITKSGAIKNSGSSTDQYAGVLYGGNRRAGAGYFFRNETGQCVRCHSTGDEGGKVGPNLGNIGNILTREQILESLVDPSVRLSPGFGSVKVTLTDGSEATGILMSENEKEIELKTNDAEPLKIAIGRISKRENLPSGMPPMGMAMTKKEIRDVIEFLASQKNE